MTLFGNNLSKTARNKLYQDISDRANIIKNKKSSQLQSEINPSSLRKKIYNSALKIAEDNGRPSVPVILNLRNKSGLFT